VSEITKAHNTALDVFWPLGLPHAMNEGFRDEREYLHDISTTFIPRKWEKYRFCIVED
jgi:hypothetical protein